MRIAVVIEHFDPRRGGAETYTAGLVNALVHAGHEVTVFAENWTLEPANVTLVKIPVKGITAAGRALSFATEASQLAAEGAFDVVHSMARILRLSVFHPHGGVMRASLERSLASSRTGLQRGLRKAARWLNTKSDMLLEIEEILYEEEPPPRFIAVSQMVARDMRQYHNVPDDRIDVVYNGVDTERFRPENRAAYGLAVREELGIPEDAVVALLVAHNYRLKGADVFIRTLASLAGRGGGRVHGLIVGGADPGIYPGLAEKMGLSGKVHFQEATDRIERFYAAADMYLHPTFYDPMSLVVLEALASGLPVVTTRYNGASEIMTDGVEGFIVEEPRDAGAILSASESLLDRSRRSEMSQAARALAEKFPFERNFKGIQDVYAKAAAEGRIDNVEIRKGE